MRRCSAVPSSYVAAADQGGAPGSGEVLPTTASFSTLLLPPLFLGLTLCGAVPPAAVANGLRVRAHDRWLL
jgi:hypothetical protein